MPEYFFWPYDEVVVERSGAGLCIRSPWIEAQLPETEENSGEIHKLIDALKTGPASREAALLVSDYFEPLDAHSLCYILPSALPEGLDAPISKAELRDLNFSQMLCAAIAASEALSPDDKLKLSADLLDSRLMDEVSWNWDGEAAQAFAALGESFHPQSLLSVARRYHLLSLMHLDRGRDVFASIRQMPEEGFRRAVLSLVRQNHYVTVKCSSSLEPAIAQSGRARPRVEAFMREEQGHDRILGRALEALGAVPEEVPVSVETRILMCLLEFAAQRNFLAFAIAVEFFERRGYESEDPLAELLGSRGFDAAAKWLNQHKKINDAGEHHATARGFLEWMAPVSSDYAMEALRLAEAISRLMAQVSQSAVAPV